MMTRIYPVFILGAAALLSACASQPVEHYSLLPAASSVVAEGRSPVPAEPLVLDVLPVGLPAAFDRQELVARKGDRFVILGNARWGSVLSDEMRETLGLFLQRRLALRNASGLIPPSGAPVLRVKLMVRQLEPLPGRSVEIDADWSLSRSDLPEAERRLCYARETVAWPTSEANDATALVRGYQMAFDALARQIARTVQRMTSGGDGCMPPAK